VLAEWGWQLLLDGTYDAGWAKTQEALELAKSQRIKAYFLVNEILFRKCQNQDFYSLQEEIEAMALSNNDKLLMRFLEKALSYPCKEE